MNGVHSDMQHRIDAWLGGTKPDPLFNYSRTASEMKKIYATATQMSADALNAQAHATAAAMRMFVGEYGGGAKPAQPLGAKKNKKAPIKPDPYHIKCKYCGSGRLRWRHDGLRWRLQYKDGSHHHCSRGEGY